MAAELEDSYVKLSSHEQVSTGTQFLSYILLNPDSCYGYNINVQLVLDKKLTNPTYEQQPFLMMSCVF